MNGRICCLSRNVFRFLRIRKTVVVAGCGSLAVGFLVTGCHTSPAPAPTTTCESLDTLTPGARAVVGVPPVNSFQPPTMDIGARPFTWASGVSTSTGYAEIQTGSKAGGSGNEMQVNNILVTFSVGFGQTLETLRFSFGEYGGNLNLWINNQFTNFNNFADIHGTTIGGVQVNVLSGGNGNDKGQIEFVGHMVDQAGGRGQLAVGGQELWIDDICFRK
jgi:hypothetical protein